MAMEIYVMRFYCCGFARHFVRPDLGQNCLQRLSADDTSRQRVKPGILLLYVKKISIPIISGILFAFLSSADFFSKSTFSKNYFRNTIRV